MAKYNTESVEGRIYQLSFDGKNAVKGWLLLVSDEKEYLIKQNSILGRNHIPRQVYRSSINLSDYKISEPLPEKKERFTYVSKLAIAMPIARLITILVPADIFYGQVNLPMSFITGLINVLIFGLIALASFAGISYFRTKTLEKKMKSLSGNLLRIGRFSTKVPLSNLRHGVEGTDKRLRMFAYVILIIYILPSILIAFYVRLRLFNFLLIYLLELPFYNGNYISDKKLATYEIQRLEEEKL